MSGLPTSQRALVTGASGYLGTPLVAALAALGVEVHALARRSPPEPHDGVTWHRADVSDAASVARVVEAVHPTVVWHLAGLAVGGVDPGLAVPMYAVNTLGTVNVLAAAHRSRVGRVVLAGSIEQRSHGHGPPTPYAASKQAAEAAGRLYAGQFGLSVVQLRIAMVYGPGERRHEMLVPHVLTSLLRGHRPAIDDPGRAIDWVFIDDVVEALLAAAALPAGQSLVADIGSGETATVAEIVTRLHDLLGQPYDPGAYAPSARSQPPADLSTARRLGWSPTTSLDDGLRRTVAWWEGEVAADRLAPALHA